MLLGKQQLSCREKRIGLYRFSLQRVINNVYYGFGVDVANDIGTSISFIYS